MAEAAPTATSEDSLKRAASTASNAADDEGQGEDGGAPVPLKKQKTLSPEEATLKAYKTKIDAALRKTKESLTRELRTFGTDTDVKRAHKLYFDLLPNEIHGEKLIQANIYCYGSEKRVDTLKFNIRALLPADTPEEKAVKDLKKDSNDFAAKQILDAFKRLWSGLAMSEKLKAESIAIGIRGAEQYMDLRTGRWEDHGNSQGQEDDDEDDDEEGGGDDGDAASQSGEEDSNDDAAGDAGSDD